MPADLPYPGATANVARAGKTDIGALFSVQAALRPEAVAVEDDVRHCSYGDLNARANRIVALLQSLDIHRGDRVALLSENRIEFVEWFIAAAKSGVILACQNWRLAPPELRHCLELVSPRLTVTSERHAGLLTDSGFDAAPVLEFGEGYETLLAVASDANPVVTVDPEDPLAILYTSGTTGLPKGAVISHRAQYVRNLVTRVDFGLAPRDTYVAWSPLYHMGGADYTIGALISGGKVIVVDGFQTDRMVDIAVEAKLGWLVLMPGMLDDFVAAFKARNKPAAGMKICGVMADLVPRHLLAEVSELLQAPYCNTFGATETGSPPATGNLLPIGRVPNSLAKEQSAFAEIRLVDEAGLDVADGNPGELLIRGPTLFSGYWNNPEANDKDFADGWFHMGDVFVRDADGRLNFVDRAKYMIKSGGENIYPAEIERVLMAEAGVLDAAVVRCPDPKWGEIPIAFVARRDDTVTEAQLAKACRQALAGYKQPKQMQFIAMTDFPRSASGKIQHHELEKRIHNVESARG